MLVAAGATAAVSCGSGSASDKHNDSVVSNETNDSIMIYYGRTIGGNILSNLDAYARETGDTLDKEEYLAGLQYLLSEERSNDFLSGVAYAGEGKIKKVAANTYIITPYSVDIMGDLIDELENSGLYM